MKNSFELIKEISGNKKRYLLQSDDDCVPFLIQRGLSMVSQSTCSILNDTTNVMYNGLDNQMFMDLFKMLTPISRSYTPWVKKDKKEDVVVVNKKTENDQVAELALKLERSETHIKQLMEVEPNLLSFYFTK